MSGTREAPFWAEEVMFETMGGKVGVTTTIPTGTHQLLLRRVGKRGQEITPKHLFAGTRAYIEAAAHALNEIHRKQVTP